jgi:hypothetical protein
MGDRSHKRRRVFVEDSRHNGGYLRATWHPGRRIFTISTWTGEVCTGAVRVPAAQAPELVSLVVDGLAELAVPADAVPVPGPVRAPARASRSAGRSVVDAVRRWLQSRTAVVPPALPLRRPAPPPRSRSGRTDEQTA